MEGRILVVDDNPTNLKLACDVLEMVGYTIYRAVDAEGALDAIEREPPELILMDIELPGIDGLTLTRMIKGAPKSASITIVALTAFAMKGDDQRALDAGCDAYISKPIDTRTLPHFLAELLERRRAGRPAGGAA